MNNFILSFIFLICLIFYYILIGSFFLTKIKIEKNKYAVYVIVGWMITFSLGWITGFPAQLNSKSWFYFANHFQIVLIVIGLLSLIGNVFLHRSRIKSICIDFKNNPYLIIQYILEHLKKYWFIYLFVGIFTWFSITNLQPYTLNNYTDDHYIVKMVHMLKSNALFNEYYATGEPLKSYGKYSFALQQSHRLFNTYEVVYTYLANLFSIDMVTFARFTMTIHNYFICFLGIQLLGSIFVDNDLSQYTIAFFILLLIPEGYAARGMNFLKIRIFENWRNQTAIYMGGSIVRNLSFPLLIYFSYLFYFYRKFRYLLFFPLIFIALLSYQTTIISYILLFIPVFITTLLMSVIWSKYKCNKNDINRFLVLLASTMVVFLGFSIFIVYADNFVENLNISSNQGITKIIIGTWSLGNGVNKRALIKLYNGYLPYYKNVFKLDSFAKIAPFVILLLLCTAKKIKQKVIIFMIGLLYLMFKTNKLKLFLSLISIDFFGTARILNSVILLIIFLSNIVLLYLLDYLFEYIRHSSLKKLCSSLLAFCICISCIVYMNANMKRIITYHKAGDGVIKQGYSTFVIKNNDKMLPQFALDIGEYFKNQKGNKFAVFSESINYKNLTYSSTNLLLASSKIMNYYPNSSILETAKKHGDVKKVNEIKYISQAYWWMNEFLNGKKWKNRYDLAEPFFRRGKLNYVFFTDAKHKDMLLKNGWKVVVGSNSKKYWLLKR